MTDLDEIDGHMIRLLRAEGRISNSELATRIGLSPSACLRRLRLLEHRGVIRGYTALIDRKAEGERTVVIVQITLERQTDDCLDRFEAAARECPEIRECHLMTGIADYLLLVEARNANDYERIHKDLLSRMPGVSRIQSNFAIRTIIQASAPQ